MPKPSRKRISVMPFRKRGRPDVSGPALQVVDMEKPTDEADKEIDSQDQGVRLAIHLEAFTEHGESANYFCIDTRLTFR